MVSKKAFLRTLEAILAISISFIFLSIILPTANPATASLKNENILEGLAQDQAFRACVIAENRTCINQTLDGYLQIYSYTVNISKTPNGRANNLPARQVFSESLLIAGNSTLYDPKVIRIYYWDKK